MWYVYILECRNKTLYTGVTNNINRRIEDHKQGNGGRYTKIAGVNKLLFKEEFSSRVEAKKRESQIKRWTWRGRPTRKVRRLHALEWKMGMLSGPIMAQMEKLKARLS